MLELRVDWKNPGQARAVYFEREGKAELTVGSSAPSIFARCFRNSQQRS